MLEEDINIQKSMHHDVLTKDMIVKTITEDKKAYWTKESKKISAIRYHIKFFLEFDILLQKWKDI